MSTLFTGTFAELQPQFIETVKADRARGPLAPLTAIISGELVRRSLSRELVWSGCPHANVRFSTLNELAHEYADHTLQQTNLQLLGDVPRDLLLTRAVDRVHGKLQYFKSISTHRGFRTKLQTTLDDLQQAGVSPEVLREASGKIRTERSATPRKLRELADLWQSYDTVLSDHNLIDRNGVLREAVAQVKTTGGVDHPLIVYGLVELSSLERRFLQALAAQTEVTAFLPYLNTPAYELAKPLLEWFQSCGFQITPLANSTDSPTLLNTVARNVFCAPEQAEPHEPDAEDASLSIISAPDPAREADEIVREVLFPPIPVTERTRTVVLLRHGKPGTDLLRASLRRAGLSAYFHECRTLGETPPGAALRRLVRLLDGRYRRTDITDFLLSSPLKQPADFRESDRRVAAADWSRLALEAGISEGRRSWTAALTRLANRFQWKLDHSRTGPEPAPTLQLRIDSLGNLQQYFDLLSTGIESVRKADTWQVGIESLWNLFTDLIELDEESEGIRKQLDQLDGMDRARLKFSVDGLRSTVDVALQSPARREGRFQENEPTVATVRQALGAPLDNLLIMDVSAGRFPKPSPHDPLLLDDERAALNDLQRIAGRTGQVPLRSHWSRRERYFYAGILSGARNRVVLTFSRGDNREHSASHYLLNTLSALTGAVADHQTLDGFLDRHRFSRRITGAASSRPSTVYEYDQAALARAFREETVDPLAHLHAQPVFRRCIEAERQRYHSPEFTDYDGVLSAGALGRAFAEWATEHAGVLDATAMEMLWDCPFRWFGKYLLGIEETEETGRLESLDPMSRGSLIHKLLERFFRREAGAGRLSSQSADDWPRLREFAEAELTEYARNHPTGPAMLWDLERREILGMLEHFFLADVEAREGFIPKHFEMAFGLDEDSPSVEYRLAEGQPVRLRGKIDRVDEHPDGRLRILDYKSGKRESTLPKGGLLASRSVQLHLYRIAAAELLKQHVESAAYWFLREKPATGRAELSDVSAASDEPRLTRVLTELLSLIRQGRFPPYPDEKVCRYCDVRAACGTGRFTHKWPLAANAQDFRELRELEVEP